MSDIQPEHIVRKNTKSRRRKKRRTEDFSSSSSSSSSSDSESENVNQEPSVEENVPEPIQVDESNSTEPVQKSYNAIEQIKASVQARLNQVQFTEGSSTKQLREELKTSDTKDDSIKENSELDQAYLQLMTSQFGDDLDELRKKPDFNQTSLMVLIEALKSSKNIFNYEELQELTSKRA